MSRLILKSNASHEEWLRMRNTGIGGSDAASIMGYNPRKSALQLWMEKTGQTEPEDLSNNERVYWGTVLEEPVARRFAAETGKRIRRSGTLRDDAHPYMIANPDRMLIGENAGLEIKTTASYLGKNWEGDNIPDAYYFQCLHYMAVTGADRWYIAALIGGQEMTYKCIQRRDEEIDMLRKAEAAFWQHVEDKTPPPADGSESAARALAQMYRETKPEPMTLPEAAADLIQRIDDANEAAKEAKAKMQLAKNQLAEMMGPYEVGVIGDRRVDYKFSKPRETIAAAKVKKQDPAAYEALKEIGLVTVSAASRSMRIY